MQLLFYAHKRSLGEIIVSMRSCPGWLSRRSAMSSSKASRTATMSFAEGHQGRVKHQSMQPLADNVRNASPDLILLRYGEPLLRFSLFRRYKRFLGEAKVCGSHSESVTSNEEGTTIYVPNTGPMRGLVDDLPKPALLSKSNNSNRKYSYTLEWIQSKESWVGVHSSKANLMVKTLLQSSKLDSLGAFERLHSEVKFGRNLSSRVDFVLERPAGDLCYVEVKSVTLAEESSMGKVALFPDTKSERAQRHTKELTDIVMSGGEAAIIFLVQRSDCTVFAPSWDHDPEYAHLVLCAQKEGVKVIAVSVCLQDDCRTVMYNGELPIHFEYDRPE